MRQSGTLMINHGISREGLSCKDCHVAEGGRLDFVALGAAREVDQDAADDGELPAGSPRYLMEATAQSNLGN